MAAYEVPPNVREFLSRSISSVEELEVLLWLRRSQREATGAEVALELRSSESSVALRLKDLVSRGLLKAGASPESYRYGPDSPSTDAAVAELAECYRTAPFKIMELIYTGPAAKIQTFADAFRLKKGKP